VHEEMQRFLKPMFEEEICTTIESQGSIISFFCSIGPFTLLEMNHLLRLWIMCTSLVSLFWLKAFKCTYDLSFGKLCTLKDLVLKTHLVLELFLVQISFTFDGGAPYDVEGVCSI
jgi:hypothetical protein